LKGKVRVGYWGVEKNIERPERSIKRVQNSSLFEKIEVKFESFNFSIKNQYIGTFSLKK